MSGIGGTLMDLRVEKTKRSIINSFLELRSHKALEKITVKELAARAEINKATFYLHYHDIYELSETLEREAVKSTLEGIQHPEELFRNNRRFMKELGDSFAANEQLIKILFEGSRSGRFTDLFEEELMDVIRNVHPDYSPTLENRMKMSYMIYGGYYTYFKYCDYGLKAVLDIMEKFSDVIIKLYD